MPCSLGDTEPGLVRVSDVLGSNPMSLVYRRESRHSASHRAVLDFAIEVVSEHGDLLAGRRPQAQPRSRRGSV